MHSGLKTYDITDPANPTLLGSYSDSYTFTHLVLIEGEYAYISDLEDGLEIINISNPSELNIIGHYTSNVGPTAGSTDAYKLGDLAFLASQSIGLEIINCSDPYNPEIVSSYYDNERVIRVYARENQVFISEAWNGFKILNITGYECVEIFHYTNTVSYQDFFVLENLLYTTDRNYGLRVFDISDFTNIVQIGGMNIGASYEFVLGQREETKIAYVSNWESGLQVLNITEPENIQQLAQYNDGGDAYNVAVKGELVFVAEFHDGLEILQIKTTSDGVTQRRSSIIPGFELSSLVIMIILSQLMLRAMNFRTKRDRKTSF
ncbi:MAG: LVIVD repeat-containing protein [Candidatus Hodarchaeota archaeon]